MKKLLILGAGEMQIPVIKRAKELGVYTIVADVDHEAPGFMYADKILNVSTLDIDALKEEAISNNVNGILTTSDQPVNVVAKLSTDLNLTSSSIEVAKICTNKYLQRNVFLNNSIKAPSFKLCSNIDDLYDLNDFPYIVKPIDSSASRGVAKVFDKDGLVNAFYTAIEYSISRKVIVESYLEGREFSVETFTQNGVTAIIAITEKLVIGEEYGCFVEDTHIEPARINENEYKIIVNEVKKALDAIGFNNCPSHTELKLNSKGAFIIETACRLGGDYITSDLVPLSTGVDMLENLIKVSLNEKCDFTRKINKVSCVQFINNRNYNRCIDFISSQDSSIVRYDIKPYSDKLIKSSHDRLGYIILRTSDMSELETILNKINDNEKNIYNS